MNGLEKIIEYIKADSDAQCAEIERDAAAECERVRSEYAKKEQDEYWKYLGVGAKEAEQRLAQLNELADHESKRQIILTQQEMVDAAFSLAAAKLTELPENEYIELLAKYGADPELSAEDFIAQFREDMTSDVRAALFD